MKLKEAFQNFLQVPHSEQTRATYRKVLTQFVDEIGGGRPLDLIRPEDLDAYVSDLGSHKVRYEDHPRRPAERGGLSDATITKHVKTIKRLFNWCVERGYLAQSPARFLTIRRPVRPFGTGKAATDTEVGEILGAAHYKPRDWAVVLLLVQSGCRASEVAKLKVRDLDLDRLVASVDGKGGKRRTILFGPETADAIRAWLEERPEDAEHDFVFTSIRGHRPLTAQSISQLVRRLCRTAKLDRSLGAHAFRHYVAMKLARAHVAPTVIKEYLGHSNLSTTMGYVSSVDESDLRAAGELLSVVRKDGNEPVQAPRLRATG